MRSLSSILCHLCYRIHVLAAQITRWLAPSSLKCHPEKRTGLRGRFAPLQGQLPHQYLAALALGRAPLSAVQAVALPAEKSISLFTCTCLPFTVSKELERDLRRR